MLRRLGMIALVASGGVIGACGDEKDAGPTSPRLQIGSGPSCSPSSLKSAAKALAGTRSALYDLAQQFTAKNANTQFATNLFFDLAAQTANLARAGTLTDAQKTNLANVLIQGIACADVIVSDVNYSGLGYVDEFVLAAGPSGALEVRGLTFGDSDILSHNDGEHGSAGIRPPSQGFAAWYGDKVMFYGFSISSFSDELAPPTEAAFEWFTVRPRTSSPDPNLRGQSAICVVFPFDDVDPTQLRIQREETILPVGNFAIPCIESPSQLRLGGRSDSPAASMFAWLRRQLLPQPLHAFSALGTGTPSGNPKNLSPIEAINPLGATLTYAPAPSTGSVNQGIGAKVHATGAAETDWEGLLIKINAQDNNGRFVAVSPDTATTNASGIADFSASLINKPGVYKLVAVTLPGPDQDATGFTQDSVITVDNFHRLPN